jgi:hypothetical protein
VVWQSPKIGTHKLTGRSAYDAWTNDTLLCNIVDAPVLRGHDGLLPGVLRGLSGTAG